MRAGSDSIVGIATCHGLGDLGIESWWVIFSAPIQTGPEGHPTICTTGTGSLYLEVKVAGAWHRLPTPSSAKFEVRV